MPGGDLLSLLPSMRQLYNSTGQKAIIHQRVNLKYGDMFGAYPNAAYSIKNEESVPVTLNRAVFEALKPLLLNQDYIENFIEWDGQQTDYDFDMLRQYDTTMPYGSINHWAAYIWPEMNCDLSDGWIKHPNVKCLQPKRILINRTERYNNMLISYNFLRKYNGFVHFIGLPHEHELFCKQNNLDIPHLQFDNFLQMSDAMYNSTVFIGSQSMAFQIAEGLKIPRILEVCKQMPNVIGSGPGFYDFLNQYSLEYYTDLLFNK